MSTSSSSSLAFASQQIATYIGLFLFVAGLIGNPLVLVVFLSLKTFRQSSCAFYLTIMSIVNTIHLFTGIFTYIMINGFGINWTNMSIFYCKFRNFYIQFSTPMSLTCMCLATIDQFLATCSNPRWHRWNNIKIARYTLIEVCIVWIGHAIPFIFYYNHTISSITGASTCVITNAIFQKYYNLFYIPIFASGLPDVIMVLFGILAYRNVQQIAYRAVPLVRRELDKQLTSMVLLQVFCDVVIFTPQVIQVICSAVIGTPGDLFTSAQLRLAASITLVIYNFHFVGSFYIYVCASKRFRQQLIYVLFKIHLNRWHGRRVNDVLGELQM